MSTIENDPRTVPHSEASLGHVPEVETDTHTAPETESGNSGLIPPIETIESAPQPTPRRGRLIGGVVATLALAGGAIGFAASQRGPAESVDAGAPAPAEAEPFGDTPEDGLLGGQPSTGADSQESVPIDRDEDTYDSGSAPVDGSEDTPIDSIADNDLSPRLMYGEQFGEVDTMVEGMDVGGFPIRPVDTEGLTGLELVDATLHNFAWLHNTDQTDISALSYVYNRHIDPSDPDMQAMIETLSDGSPQRSVLRQYIRDTSYEPEGPIPNELGGFSATVRYDWYHVEKNIAAGNNPDYTGTFEYVPENGVENFGVFETPISLRIETAEDNSLSAIAFDEEQALVN